VLGIPLAVLYRSPAGELGDPYMAAIPTSAARVVDGLVDGRGGVGAETGFAAAG